MFVRRPSFRRLPLVAVCVFPLTLASLAAFSPAVRADNAAVARFQPVGSMPAGASGNGSLSMHLVVDPDLQRGYLAVDNYTRVRVFDLRSRTASTEIAIPSDIAVLRDSNGLAPSAFLDRVAHRVIYVAQVAAVYNPACGGGMRTEIAALDEHSGTWKEITSPCLANGDPFEIDGVTYSAGESAYYVFGHDAVHDAFTTPGPTYSYDIRRVNADTGALVWQATLPVCSVQWASVTPVSQPVVMRTGSGVTVTCDGPNPFSGGSQLYLVTVPLNPSGDEPAEDPSGAPVSYSTYPLVFTGMSVMGDQGSGLVVEVSSQPGYGFGSYVFDPSRGLFRGFVPTSNDTNFSIPANGKVLAAGIDPSTGRLYMRTQEALVASEIRHKPLDVGLAYPDLRDRYDWQNEPVDTANLHYAQYYPFQIATDPLLHRIYVPDVATHSFLVYQDSQGPEPSEQLADPDGATTNVAEAPGVTGATYSGSGDAYGAYITSEGGPNRVASNAVLDCFDPVSALLGLVAATPQHNDPCQFDVAPTPGDRAFYFGHVAHLTLSNVGVDAEAAAADIADPHTAKDLANAGVYGEGSAAPGGLPPILEKTGVDALRFPVHQPSDRPGCHDFGGSPSSDGEHTTVGNTTLHCDQSVPTVSASSSFSGTALAAGSGSLPDVGSYGATVESKVSPDGGETTTVSAWAHHVTIALPGAAIEIASITSQATTAAHGRPGTTTAHFSRSIKGVVSPSYTCTDRCDPQKVADAINAAFHQAQIPAVATVPQASAAATRGGFQGVVTKDPDLAISDATMNDDPSDAVAGLAITYYDDGQRGRARESFQLAGVHAESHYGIYLLSASSLTAPPSIPDAGPAPTGDASAPGALQTASSPTASASGKGGPGGLAGLVRTIASTLTEGWRLLVSDPKRAAMLAALWFLLLSPAYLALRRHALVSNLLRGAL